MTTDRISRQDFGITWNKSLDAGCVNIGNDVDITLGIEQVKSGRLNRLRRLEAVAAGSLTAVDFPVFQLKGWHKGFLAHSLAELLR
jgi:hypothetical protein